MENLEVKIIAYGIAREIIGVFEHVMQLNPKSTLGELRALLVEKYPQLQQLASLRFAVNENYENDDFIVKNADEIVIIPPVSGG